MTLNHAILNLHSQPGPMCSYRQRIDLRNIYTDLAYSSYISYVPSHETITLTFPPECHSIMNMKNNQGCKMVYYETKDGYIIEKEIKRREAL